MFFVISGFLITSNALRRWSSLEQLQPVAFYILRIARIIPCLVLLLAIVGILAASGLVLFQSHVPGTNHPVSPILVDGAALGFWMNALIGRLGWVNYPLGVLWSLSVEEMFYLTFPAVCLLLRRPRRIAAFWALIVLIGPLYRALHQNDEAGFLFAYFAAFDGIAIGCLTALSAARNTAIIHTSVQIAVSIAMVALYLVAPIGTTNVWGVSVMAIGTAVLLLGAEQACREPVTEGHWPRRSIEWFGRSSYELYLFHLVVLGLMRTIAPPRSLIGDSRLMLLLIFLIVSAAVAEGIRRCFAEPLNRAIRRQWFADGSRRATVSPPALR